MLIAKDSWPQRFNRRRVTRRLLHMDWHARWQLEQDEEEEKRVEEKRKARRRAYAEKLKAAAMRKDKRGAAVWGWMGRGEEPATTGSPAAGSKAEPNK